MSEKPDRRARRSRSAIFSAFETLLGEKSYTSITVGDIIDVADIGRSTFYAHFPTKDALLGELCKDIFHHILAPEPESSHSFSPELPNEQLLHVLYHLQEQRERLAPLFRSPSSNLFWSAFGAEVERYFALSLGKTIRAKANIPDDLYSHYLATSFTEIAKWWFAQELACPPEEVFEMFALLTSVRFIVNIAHIEAEPRNAGFESDASAAIKRALVDLLGEKRLESITVHELAERASVSRSTFYNHFTNIEAVYTEVVKDALSDVRSVIGNFLSDCEGCRLSDEKVPFCERVRGNDDYARIVHDPQFATALFEVIGSEESTSPTLELLLRSGLTEEQAHAIALFQSSGCFTVARSNLGLSKEWGEVKDALDEFIAAGYHQMTGGAFPHTER